MSHSSAQFYLDDGTVFWGEYNGTADIMLPRMFTTSEEMQAFWHQQDWDEHKDCSLDEPCVVESHYGRGFKWNGSACRKCMLFLGPYNPFDEDVEMIDEKQIADKTPSLLMGVE